MSGIPQKAAHTYLPGRCVRRLVALMSPRDRNLEVLSSSRSVLSV